MSAKGDLTRHNIIAKSMQLFSVKGYFNTSIADIVKATGLTKGGLYGHFRNKQEIWYAVYEECARVWKSVVFNGVREIPDPLARIARVIENSLKNYLGGRVFEGGCFLLNSLVDLAGQSPSMSNQVLKGFQGFSKLIHLWLEEAEQQGMLRDGLNLSEIANFLVISLNGAAPLYAASKDPAVWRQTMGQLHFYLQTLRKET
ncbi:MAG: TetR/AcrR family transcriptional regulator [Deltaproteobacteria bacterium]|nr:TetR/AcrR family transcriptional regulator [Deltaproteobacteria bacterium]MBI4794369.1 TetR/AcrR family transcriptional regulator [Deltaproteobacteria bacterium]